MPEFDQHFFSNLEWHVRGGSSTESDKYSRRWRKLRRFPNDDPQRGANNLHLLDANWYSAASGSQYRPRHGIDKLKHRKRNCLSPSFKRTFSKRSVVLGPVNPYMLRHACGYALANRGMDTRSLQAYLGHASITHTVRYTEMSPTKHPAQCRPVLESRRI